MDRDNEKFAIKMRNTFVHTYGQTEGEVGGQTLSYIQICIHIVDIMGLGSGWYNVRTFVRHNYDQIVLRLSELIQGNRVEFLNHFVLLLLMFIGVV